MLKSKIGLVSIMAMAAAATASMGSIVRATPGSRMGRSLIQVGKEVSGHNTQEIKDWNKQVEAKKQAKLQRKQNV